MNKPNVPIKLIENSQSALFVRAVIEDSTIELDWLWLAAQINTDAEKNYCYQQALYINPDSAEAQRGLHKLQKRAQRGGFITSIHNALEFLVARSALDHLLPVQK